MTLKNIIGALLFIFFAVVFIASVREKNWVASILWFIPLSFFLVCWGWVLLSRV